MTHWSYDEMSTAFDYDLAEYIYFGGYPGPVDLIASEDRWRDYIQTSLVEPNIERDILSLQRVDKPALLKRLFELCCEFSGQILSFTKMVGQLDDAGNATTLARYLDLLEKAGLVAGLQRYEGRGGRRRQSSPKLVVLNTALMSAHSGYTFAEARVQPAQRTDRCVWGQTRSGSLLKVFAGETTIPIEIKKSMHRAVWTSIRTELMAKYTRDPLAEGHGIHLVLWFGQAFCHPGPEGRKPESAEQLRHAVRAGLTPEESRKVSVCVFDVSKPSEGGEGPSSG